jgi:hypothetical protein
VILVLKAGIASKSSTVKMANIRQGLSKHVPMAATVHTAIEESLKRLFQCSPSKNDTEGIHKHVDCAGGSHQQFTRPDYGPKPSDIKIWS